MNEAISLTKFMWALERYNACGCVSFDYITAEDEEGFAWFGFTDFSDVETDDILVTNVYFTIEGKHYKLNYDNLEDLMQIAGILDCYDDYLHYEKNEHNIEKWEEVFNEFLEKDVWCA